MLTPQTLEPRLANANGEGRSINTGSSILTRHTTTLVNPFLAPQTFIIFVTNAGRIRRTVHASPLI